MSQTRKIIIGWREWLALPALGLPAIKAKIDTGARTSALHAFKIEEFERAEEPWLRFYLYPHKHHPKHNVQCEVPWLEKRIVSDSGGHREQRYVIVTPLQIADKQWPIEITLTNRENMRFLMLLGRTAMNKNLLINPNASYLLGIPPQHLRLGA